MNFPTSSMQKERYMQHYEVTAPRKESGFTSTSMTPSPSSTDWHDKLKRTYGIANPMAPDDGLDEEVEMVARMNEARHS